jgi:hypothetical protein
MLDVVQPDPIRRRSSLFFAIPVPATSARQPISSNLPPPLPRITSKHPRRPTPDTHLSEVELSGLLVLNALDLDESGVGSRVPLCSLVTENTSLDVETISMERRAQ